MEKQTYRFAVALFDSPLAFVAVPVPICRSNVERLLRLVEDQLEPLLMLEPPTPVLKCQRCWDTKVTVWSDATTTPCDVCSAPAPIPRTDTYTKPPDAEIDYASMLQPVPKPVHASNWLDTALSKLTRCTLGIWNRELAELHYFEAVAILAELSRLREKAGEGK